MKDAAHPVKLLDQHKQGKIKFSLLDFFGNFFEGIIFRKMANEICFEAPEINMASE